MKLLFLFTGGTIGSITKDGVTAPDRASADALVRTCLTQIARNDETEKAEEIIIDTQMPYYILSEELTPHHLNLLTEAVSDNLQKDYDAILITHGSDTILYTAALLDSLFPESPVPVFLICSNYPLSDPRANGRENLNAALALLHQDPAACGVFVPYRNEPCSPADDFASVPVRIHKGACLLRHPEASGNLQSVSGLCYAEYRNGKIIRNDAYPPSGSDASGFSGGRIRLCEHPGILQILCAPGAVYPPLPERLHAVMLIPYHSGTLPVNDPAFSAFCRLCRSRKVPILVPSAGCETYYESSDAFAALGITAVPLTAISLYIKLWISIPTE